LERKTKETVVAKTDRPDERRRGLVLRAVIAVLNLPGWTLSLLLGRRIRNSIADRGRWWDGLIGPLLFVSFLALIAGVVLPVLRVRKLFMFTDEISLANGIHTLWQADEYMLAAVVLVFSVLFPFLKQFEAYRLWRRISIYDTRFNTRLRRVEWLGKWSMVDVLMVALLVLSAKAHKLANATSEPGLYFFAGALAGTAVALTWIGMAASRLRASGLVEYPE
jgi:paraquat-inducible protein A